MEKIRKKRKTIKNKVFADKWGFTRIFMFFLIGSVIGVYYEEILHIIQYGFWESRTGLIYGPFNPVYGLGFALLVLLLGKNNDKRPWYLTYLYAFLIGGVTEYSLSWFQETLFHSTSWDYSKDFLNINGRTTIPFMIGWGFGGLIFMKVFYPFISKLISKIPYKVGKIMVPILLVFIILDMVISYSALIRQVDRLNGHEPKTPVGELYDKIYTDEFLSKVYPNMVHKKEK